MSVEDKIYETAWKEIQERDVEWWAVEVDYDSRTVHSICDVIRERYCCTAQSGTQYAFHIKGKPLLKNDYAQCVPRGVNCTSCVIIGKPDFLLYLFYIGYWAVDGNKKVLENGYQIDRGLASGIISVENAKKIKAAIANSAPQMLLPE